jgi:phosphatidylinositol glycan class H protein
LTLWTEWQLHALKEHGRDVPPWLRESGPGRAAAWATQALTARYLVPVSLLGLWILVRRGYTGQIQVFDFDILVYLRLCTEESLFVLRGLGIETTSSSSTYLSTASTRFIPTTAIQDIFIYEAFKGFEVRFYLAIVVEGEEDVVVVFPVRGPNLIIFSSLADYQQNLLPGLAILEEVWRETRTCLYQPKS